MDLIGTFSDRGQSLLALMLSPIEVDSFELMLSLTRVDSNELLVSSPIEVSMNGLLPTLSDQGRHFRGTDALSNRGQL